MNKNLKAAERLIVALDFDSVEKAEKLVQALVPQGVIHFKIGIGLFTAAGPEAVERVHGCGGSVFLDLKFHDIPKTVSRAIGAAVRMNIWMANVHAQGGAAMMREAVLAADKAAAEHQTNPTLLLGVTVLTSMVSRDLMDLGVTRPLETQVLDLAKLAQKSGLHGIVASPIEIKAIRALCGADFIIVTPGIRSGGPTDQRDDQQRIGTPGQAVQDGADYIVVGRPIIEALDPVAAAEHITEEITQHHATQ